MLQSLLGLFYLSAVSQLVTLTGTQAECLIKLKPRSVVVEYGSSVSVDCSTDVTSDKIGWEASEGSASLLNAKHITWKVSNLRRWDIRPQCYIKYNRTTECDTFLPITIYKTPDSVSINTVDHTGPMKEYFKYEFQCEIVNVAPKNLTVKWFKGETEVYSETFGDIIKSPGNVTSKLQITANRSDDGAQYRCDAELELGEDGPQPPPKVTSEPIQILVQYSPKHNDSKKIIKKTDGDVTLNCTVAANPPATYSWSSKHLTGPRNSPVLSSSTLNPGNYTCTATNYLGNSSKVFIINSGGSRTTFMVNLIFFQLLVALKIVM